MSEAMSSRRWPYALLLVGSLGSLLYCFAGFAMAASFTVSNADQLAHWQRVGRIYLGLCGLSLVGIGVALVVLVRRRPRRSGSAAHAS
jgi:hypothetical protein